jgi:hypothetical protein
VDSLLNWLTVPAEGALPPGFFYNRKRFRAPLGERMEASRMSEFILAEQMAMKLDLMEDKLPEFESQGIIKPVKKNGRTYYSSRDFYRLKGVLHFMRTNGLSIEEAQDRVANWNWFAQTTTASASAR